MSTDINLYKIDKIKDFKNDLSKNEYIKYSININKLSQNEIDCLNNVELSLYYFKELTSKTNWDWILNKFDVTPNEVKSRPKAILLIKKGNVYYAVSFGYSYHIASKYADINWPLKFAERMDYYSIKSVGILAPNSVINKKIYNYFNYNVLNTDIGEALTKITATLELDERTLEYLSNYVVVGNSIKFRIKIHNLESIINLLNYVELILLRDIKYKIPKLMECKGRNNIDNLDKKLVEKIQQDINNEVSEPLINISEFTLLSFDYVFFNSEYNNFVFHLNNTLDNFTELTVGNIYQFIKNNHLELNDNLLLMDISMFSDDGGYRCKLRDIIMYTDDKYIFNEGIWYEYNSLFFEYIHEYLEDIPVYRLEQYDFPNKEDAINIFNEMRNNMDLGNANYFEYNFNNYVAYTSENIICLDRKKYYINKQSYEFKDLLDEDKKALYAVKTGKYSNDLSYVIDQSLIGLKALDDGNVEGYNKNDVEIVGLWLVFKRSVDYYVIGDGRLDWENMELLILKSKIADWKKQVLLSGRKPVIYINYRY